MTADASPSVSSCLVAMRRRRHDGDLADSLLPRSRPLTSDDLDAMPDDGHRYELIDGTLIVSPAPASRHQVVVAGLYRTLHRRCPEDQIVLFAPVDVALGDSTVMHPDLLVARRSDLTDRDLPVAPPPAVEVLSPSTRHIDLVLKRSRFEAAGCPAYWVVDPDEPSLRAWQLRDGTYEEVGRVVGATAFHTDRPYPVDVTPDALVEP
jgi:Uma2 family endonuclease